MKTSENNNFKIFKGAGYLLGLAMAIVEAIVVFVLSNSFAAAVLASLPIGIAMGLILEQRFQKTVKNISTDKTKAMHVFLSVGLLIFFALYVFVNLV